MGAWFVAKVLPGMVLGVPYVVIGGTGLWLQLRHSKRHLDQVTADQTHTLSAEIHAHVHPPSPHAR